MWAIARTYISSEGARGECKQPCWSEVQSQTRMQLSKSTSEKHAAGHDLEAGNSRFAHFIQSSIHYVVTLATRLTSSRPPAVSMHLRLQIPMVYLYNHMKCKYYALHACSGCHWLGAIAVTPEKSYSSWFLIDLKVACLTRKSLRKHPWLTPAG